MPSSLSNYISSLLETVEKQSFLVVTVGEQLFHVHADNSVYSEPIGEGLHKAVPIVAPGFHIVDRDKDKWPIRSGEDARGFGIQLATREPHLDYGWSRFEGLILSATDIGRLRALGERLCEAVKAWSNQAVMIAEQQPLGTALAQCEPPFSGWARMAG